MREVTGNIWDYYDMTNWIVIPTNGYVRQDGKAVMGRGLALQASQRFPTLPEHLGVVLAAHGNIVHAWPKIKLVTFPVKHRWWDNADPHLIIQSVEQLVRMFTRIDHPSFSANIHPDILRPPVYLPRVGCGNGGLRWEIVKPLLEEELGDNFVVVSQKEV